MNCAFHAFVKAAGLSPGSKALADMEGYYSMLRRATGGDAGIYVGCAHWALHSVISYGHRCGWITDRMRLLVWYADWVCLDELYRHADNELAAEITWQWWHLAAMPLSGLSDQYKYIVFDLATGHASYQTVGSAHFPMMAIWVSQYRKDHVFSVYRSGRRCRT